MSEDDSRRLSTYLLFAGGMAIFGSATPVSRIIGTELPSLVGAGLRMLPATIFLVPVLLW